MRALLVACALAPAGCERITAILEEKAQEVAEDIAPPDEAAPPSGPVLSDEERLAAKLALYTECLGRASRRIRQSWQRYDERVQADGTPRKKDTAPFLYEVDTELIPCEEAVTKGPGIAPPLPEIEATMATWIEHARVFATTTKALDDYYETKGWEGDAWAKGKELAPGFLAAWQAWSVADDTLVTQIEARMEVVEQALLAQVEARTGRDIEWHARNAVLHAKAFVRCLAPPPTTVAATVAATEPPPEGSTAKAKPAARTPEPGACARELDALVTAEAGFRTYYEAHRPEADGVFWMSAFEASVSDLVAAAKAAAAPAKPGKAGSKGTAPDLIATLLHEHADLVSDANNLRFHR